MYKFKTVLKTVYKLIPKWISDEQKLRTQVSILFYTFDLNLSLLVFYLITSQ